MVLAATLMGLLPTPVVIYTIGQSTKQASKSILLKVQNSRFLCFAKREHTNVRCVIQRLAYRDTHKGSARVLVRGTYMSEREILQVGAGGIRMVYAICTDMQRQ